ncbi:AP2-like ethylene-responsive transcription factor [Seminavis robusta]|uniref:AP2-like ethylene-responsive transcription factor n=1 Tax=Seminavis robusta TaxID=568900 RepID=A0A9N8EGE3_9STRA|nr:AP2-like ethylene-responsive transcription factor [Seminavis robusta]|eukprot:Sro1151_g246750.1 AP2-like ethylene-responsive transcription factor (649) ;mRNA; f:18956-20902
MAQKFHHSSTKVSINRDTGSNNDGQSLVGRALMIRLDAQRSVFSKGMIVAYNPLMKLHTIKLLETKEQKQLSLKNHELRWLKKKSKKPPFELAIKRAAVGRSIRLLSQDQKKTADGTIIQYLENVDKHTIRLEKTNTLLTVNLDRGKWQYTDLIGGPTNSEDWNNALVTSRYLGVERISIDKWSSKIRKPNGETFNIGTFSSETDAAMAYDACARDFGQQKLNFPKRNNSTSDSANQPSDTTLEEPLEEQSSSSKYRGVTFHITSTTWQAQILINNKSCVLGHFVDEKHAALAFDLEARKVGWPQDQLNFPDEQATEEQIHSWIRHRYGFSQYRYRGVSFNKRNGKWHARITNNGSTCYLGSFLEENHAALAYDFEARKLQKPELRLNFPDEHPTAEQICEWKENSHGGSSQYHGVSYNKRYSKWHAIISSNSLGYFLEEKHAALAYDFEARKSGQPELWINFPDEHPTAEQICEWRQKHGGSSQYRGVTYDKQSSKWWAHIRNSGSACYLGSFLEEKHAALAYDFEARKSGQPELWINFPDEHPTAEQICEWKQKHGGSSQYRGVTYNKKSSKWRAQITNSGSTCYLGSFLEEKHAALAYDFEARKSGQPELWINFPDEHPTAEQICEWRQNMVAVLSIEVSPMTKI